MDQHDLTNFKNGVISLSNKHFGQFNEFMLKRLLRMKLSRSVYYDLIDGNNRVEVKFSRAFSKRKKAFTEDNVLEYVKAGRDSQLLYLHQAMETDFVCNFQHIKETEFDTLIYGIYFYDRVLVFLLTKDDLNNPEISFGRQSLGNVLEKQFRIDKRSLPYHLENQHLFTLSYADIHLLFEEALPI